MGMKKLSTHCNKCGVEWLPDLSNKKPKRSVCLECARKEQRDLQQKQRLPTELHRRNRFSEYTKQKRQPYYSKINKELLEIKDRNEWRKYFDTKFNEIINNKILWEYIRTDWLEDTRKQYKKIKDEHKHND
jgi:hypothetical protein